jgi:hypothetical protein
MICTGQRQRGARQWWKKEGRRLSMTQHTPNSQEQPQQQNQTLPDSETFYGYLTAHIDTRLLPYTQVVTWMTERGVSLFDLDALLEEQLRGLLFSALRMKTTCPKNAIQKTIPGWKKRYSKCCHLSPQRWGESSIQAASYTMRWQGFLSSIELLR